MKKADIARLCRCGAAVCLALTLILGAGEGAAAAGPASAPRTESRVAFTATGADRVYRSCRRQVRRAAGIIPGMRMRLPRAYIHLVDRCVANGGVYS